LTDNPTISHPHCKHLAKTTGLTAPQTQPLQTIRGKNQVTIGELANQVSLSQATVPTIFDSEVSAQ